MLLNKDASSLLYATFIGGDDVNSDGDHVDGGTSRFDNKVFAETSIDLILLSLRYKVFNDVFIAPLNEVTLL